MEQIAIKTTSRKLFSSGRNPVPIVQRMVAAFGPVHAVTVKGILRFAICETSHPELDETSAPTKPRQLRSGKLVASPYPPS